MSEANPRTESLFWSALAISSPEARDRYLDESCGGDQQLRDRVEELLAAYPKVEGFLESPACSPAATVDEAPAERSGALIGPYKLLELIGEGGMGTVWMAQQFEPVKRLVAVKLIKAGMDSKQIIARFEAERQALAMMDHPNIARVLEAGTSGAGRPYFVMDLVKGVPITRYCDEHRLTPRQRLELFVPVCQAVQHAHQKGIIHRDLKPGNVLVASYDGKAMVKVIDFGVAKAAGQALTEQTLVTGFGAIVGTLEYMSPEQAEINQLDVDTRSDIYSLGVLLYELLTGGPPFSRKGHEQGGLLEMLRVIREQEPTKPSAKLSTAEGLPTLAANRGTEPAKLTKLVRGELDWIVMKALEKDRNRRYETANSFALDLQRYLLDEPVLACSPSASYRLRKFVKRNRGPVLAASLVVLALVGGIVGTTVGLLRAEQARKDAVSAQEAEAAQHRTAEEERAVAQVINDFLQKDLLGQADPENQAGGAVGLRDPNIKVRTALDRAARSIEARFANQPRVEAALRATIAQAYVGLGQYKQAQFHAERSVLLRTTHLGAEYADTLKSMDALCDAYRGLGLHQRAEALCQEVLQKRTGTLGPDHLDTLTNKYRLGCIYGAQAKYTQAEPLFREVAQKREARLGPHDAATLLSKHTVAWLHVQTGNHDIAAGQLLNVIKAVESTFGKDYPLALAAKTNLAWVRAAQGENAQAEALFREVLQKWIAIRGPKHPETLMSKVVLGSVYRNQRKFDQAVPMLEEAVEGLKASLGEDHPATLRGMMHLALTHRAMGKLKFAVSLFEQTLEKLNDLFPPDYYLTPHVRTELVRTYVAAKTPGKAITLSEQSLARLKEHLGSEDPRTLAAMHDLVCVRLEANRPEEALALLRECHDRQRRRLGAESTEWATCLAESCRELLKHEQHAEAEKHLRECLAIRMKKEPDDWQTFHTRSLLGAALLGQKKYADAEPLLLRGYLGLKEREARIPPPLKPVHLTAALGRLVQLSEATNRQDEASRWRKELKAQSPSAGSVGKSKDE